MSKCQWTPICHNHATVMLKCRSVGFGGLPGHFVLKKKICQQCWNALDPENRTRVTVTATGEDQDYYERLGLERKYSEACVLHYRKIR